MSPPASVLSFHPENEPDCAPLNTMNHNGGSSKQDLSSAINEDIHIARTPRHFAIILANYLSKSDSN